MGKRQRRLLDAFLRSNLWLGYESDFSLNLQYWYINDPERADRMERAFSGGNSGLTHAEVMDDWTDCVKNSDLKDATKERLYKEIKECREWHDKNGSLDDQQ
jgi:hypothetical protein